MEKQRRRVAARTAQGLCFCGRHIAKGKTLCQEHLNKQRGGIKRLIADRRKNGQCIDCGEPKVNNSISRCRSCLDRINTRQKQRRAQNLIYGLYLHYYPRADSYKTGEGELRDRFSKARCYEPDAIIIAITQLPDKLERIHKHDEIKAYWDLNGNEVFYPEEHPNVRKEAFALFDIVNFDGINLDELIE
jgi:hypothetical protein